MKKNIAALLLSSLLFPAFASASLYKLSFTTSPLSTGTNQSGYSVIDPYLGKSMSAFWTFDTNLSNIIGISFSPFDFNNLNIVSKDAQGNEQYDYVSILSHQFNFGSDTYSSLPWSGFVEFNNLNVSKYLIDVIAPKDADNYGYYLIENNLGVSASLANKTQITGELSTSSPSVFTLQSIPSPVPAPAALPMFSAGLLFIGSIVKRNKQKQKIKNSLI